MLERRVLTNMVIEHVKTAGHPVGDSWAPTEDYGWSDTAKAPGSHFIPYVIITPGTTNRIDGSLAHPDSDAWFPYQVSGFGSTRDQCEWIMDAVREHVDLLKDHYILGVINPDVRWKISYIDTIIVGGIVRGGPEDNPIFGQTDTFSLFMSEDFHRL
jgi:hypothetical protein